MAMSNSFRKSLKFRFLNFFRKSESQKRREMLKRRGKQNCDDVKKRVVTGQAREEEEE